MSNQSCTSVHLDGGRGRDGRWRTERKRNSLNHGGEGEGKGGELGEIAFQMPGFRLCGFISWNGDPGVLTEAGSDDDRRFSFEESVDLPMLGSIVDPCFVTVRHEEVETSEGLEVEANGSFATVEK